MATNDKQKIQFIDFEIGKINLVVLKRDAERAKEYKLSKQVKKAEKRKRSKKKS